MIMALPNQECTTVHNKDNWKIVLNIDFEIAHLEPNALEPPLHSRRASSSSQHNTRPTNEESNSMNIEAMREQRKELKHLMWNTFHLVEDIHVQVGNIDESLDIHRDDEDLGSNGEMSSN